MLGLVAFPVSVVVWGLGPARGAAGMLIVTVSGGVMVGARISMQQLWHRERPESKPKLLALVLAIGAVGMAGVVLGGFAAGVMGSG